MIAIQKVNSIALQEVLPLYEAVGWTNYTQQPQILEGGLAHSLAIHVARDGDQLVGLIRLIGDGYSSIFVQDLLVLPSYQGQGIGRDLLRQALRPYKNAYQVQLVTDRIEKTLGFYNSLGFVELESLDCTGMTWVDREK